MNPLQLLNSIVHYLNTAPIKTVYKQQLDNNLKVKVNSSFTTIQISKSFENNYNCILQLLVAAHIIYQKRQTNNYNLNEAIKFAENYFDKFYNSQMILEDSDIKELSKIV